MAELAARATVSSVDARPRSAASWLDPLAADGPPEAAEAPEPARGDELHRPCRRRVVDLDLVVDARVGDVDALRVACCREARAPPPASLAVTAPLAVACFWIAAYAPGNG